MQAAHDEGARVTAHVFGEHALPDLIGSGIDCIEHGTGLSTDLIDDDGRPTGSHWCRPSGSWPTSRPTPRRARRKFPRYADHMLSLYETRRGRDRRRPRGRCRDLRRHRRRAACFRTA